MAALFPVIETQAVATLYTQTLADERESAWSLMARTTQAAQQREGSFRLRFDEATKQLTIAADITFTLQLSLGGDTLTGFPGTSSGASSYTGSALTDVIVVEGLRMAPPGWSTTGGKTSADGTAVNRPRWSGGSVSLAMAVTYADAFSALKTLRKGVWDVVNEGIWLGRIRVTGSSLEPQGRLPGIVEARINGVAVP